MLKIYILYFISTKKHNYLLYEHTYHFIFMLNVYKIVLNFITFSIFFKNKATFIKLNFNI